jgi:hypothetical protein
MKKFNSVYEFVKFISRPNYFYSNDTYFIREIPVNDSTFTGILNNLRDIVTIQSCKEEFINELFEINGIVYCLSSHTACLCLKPV